MWEAENALAAGDGSRSTRSRPVRRIGRPAACRMRSTTWERRMSQKKVIAVMGATGAQGGGLVRAIHADRDGPFTARAISRKRDSEKAQELATLGIQIVTGDADDPPSLERAFAGA